jgi:hypothetical protein
MKRLELKESSNTPHVIMDSQTASILIEGKSFPEDSKEFYKTILDWMEEYRLANPSSLTLTFNLFYLSSSSIISVKQLLMKLVEINSAGAKTKVLWCFDDDDDDIKKTGEDYARITKLDFEFRVNA